MMGAIASRGVTTMPLAQPTERFAVGHWAWRVAEGRVADTLLTQATGSDWTLAAWRGIVAPKGLPKDISDRLLAALEKVHKSAEFNDFMKQRGFGVAWMPPAEFADSNWHMFQPLLPPDCDRGRFIAAMRERGIGIGVHYPAIHLFAFYRRQGWREGDCPNAEDIGRRIVTLPLFPAMSDADVDRVCRALPQALAASCKAAASASTVRAMPMAAC